MYIYNNWSEASVNYRMILHIYHNINKIIWLENVNYYKRIYDSPEIEGSDTWFAAKTWVERIIKRITPRNIDALE
jgi:hypothetical protein